MGTQLRAPPSSVTNKPWRQGLTLVLISAFT